MKFQSQCPAHGCPNKRGPAKLLCYSCWRRLPVALKSKIYAAWNDGTPTPAYDTVVADALAFLDRQVKSEASA